ncbi:bacteriophage antitermination protein Q [Zooshikella ganghwensis]|uniref:Uncharacterized protein n=1 Tax=Zooshikella ganghwensis TaxID=202772 RepID=A0A4P9VHB6_9GAMM|nr:bacteriophage antitermination protein Q [Zooshikella ganghwensis]RDH41610.1 hypothetical protein B9G39_27495 [Zooshikella ganghwensis]RDH41700.1 hypothetical protein B9G39_26950 [Zooshikella ganghwensis]
MNIRKAIHDAYCINLRSNTDLNPELQTKRLSIEKRLIQLNKQLKTEMRNKQRIEQLLAYKPAQARADSSAKTNVNDIIGRQVEAGKVIAAVESLPGVQRAWVKWCYAPTLNDNVMKLVSIKERVKSTKKEVKSLTRQSSRECKQGSKYKHINRCIAESAYKKAKQLNTKAKSKSDELEQLMSRYHKSLDSLGVPEIIMQYFYWHILVELNRQSSRKKPEQVVDKIKRLVPYWVTNYKHYINTQQWLFKDSDLYKVVGGDKKNYQRAYKSWQLFMHDLCSDLDKSALPEISAKIRSKSA